MFADDICFCSNVDCPLRKNCWRAHQPKEEYISVSRFEPNNSAKCDYFLEYPKGVKKTLWNPKQKGL